MRPTRRNLILFTLALLPGMLPVAEAAEPAKPAEAKKWAASIEKPGLPNLHRVSAGLYRGAQPTAEGMKELEKLGVKTVINLRAFHSDKKAVAGTELVLEEIPVVTWDPSKEEVARFLKIVTDKKRCPVFVHCQHGADRTGTMCAIYRLVVCGWTKQEAIQEMTKGGFGFHPIWTNLPKFIEKLDVDSIKPRR